MHSERLAHIHCAEPALVFAPHTPVIDVPSFTLDNTADYSAVQIVKQPRVPISFLGYCSAFSASNAVRFSVMFIYPFPSI
jgi:hypothetical protein